MHTKESINEIIDENRECLLGIPVTSADEREIYDYVENLKEKCSVQENISSLSDGGYISFEVSYEFDFPFYEDDNNRCAAMFCTQIQSVIEVVRQLAVENDFGLEGHQSGISIYIIIEYPPVIFVAVT